MPSLAEAVSATGGAGIALGILLITIDIRASGSGRVAEAALFAGLTVAGFLVLAFLPTDIHPAGITAVVFGIPGALGWALLPGAHRFADVRPFLILTILGWCVAFLVPFTRGRTIFVGATALLLWLWILGEVAGTSAFSAAPIPSPPAHTLFSLSAFSDARATVELSDLDASDPLYPLAQSCDFGDAASCDQLYREAPFGSAFRQFAATCGNTAPVGSGDCETRSGSLSPSPVPNFGPIGSVGTTHDKSTEIGLVSLMFGVAYLAALYLLDRERWRGLATAFVVPSFVALLTGTQTLGNAAHHAWVGGFLTMFAGVGIGFVGDRTERRFTTWAGGFAIAVGALTVALDASHISRSVSDGNVKLAGPGLIVASFGIGLVAFAYVIAQLLGRAGPAGSSSAGNAPPPTETPWPTTSTGGAAPTGSPPSRDAPPSWPSLP